MALSQTEAVAAPVPSGPSIAQKLELLENTASGLLVERSTEVHTAILALISKHHHFQLGQPGVAKSLLVRTVLKLIDGFDVKGKDYFERLLTKYSTPEELFGPPNIKELAESGRYVINTAGTMVEALVAFLDEIFEGNSAIINSLLTISNERLFQPEAGCSIECPLWTIFGASNRMPETGENGALVDRLMFKHYVQEPREPGVFKAMLSLAAKGQGLAAPVISVAEIQQAQEEAAKVQVDDDVLSALTELRMKLNKEGIYPTPRKFAQSLSVIRAQAYLNGRHTADIDDIRPLAHVFWDQVDQIPFVVKEVRGMANPLDREAMDLKEQVDKLAVELDNALREGQDNTAVMKKKGIEIHGKIERATEELKQLQERASKGNRKSEAIKELEDRIASVSKTVLKEIFGIER